MLLALLKFIPWQAWAVLAAAIAFGAWYWHQTSAAYERGKTEVTTTIQKEQSAAQDRAEAERRKLDKGDDSAVRRFDRD